MTVYSSNKEIPVNGIELVWTVNTLILESSKMQ
jgi:hypothetical protein